MNFMEPMWEEGGILITSSKVYVEEKMQNFVWQGLKVWYN